MGKSGRDNVRVEFYLRPKKNDLDRILRVEDEFGNRGIKFDTVVGFETRTWILDRGSLEGTTPDAVLVVVERHLADIPHTVPDYP